jgi:glucose-1-phosphate cytidylyltransferase
MTIDMTSGKVDAHQKAVEDWIVNLIDTGPDTPTGARVKRLEPWLRDGTFMVTYGDGVCDVDLEALVKFHKEHGRIATVTAVRPPARFGGLAFDDDHLADFIEKPQAGEGWINGGYLVFEPGIFEYLDAEQSGLEADALERLAADRQLVAFPHYQFWQCMDTLRDVRLLENMWQEKKAPWKMWE